MGIETIKKDVGMSWETVKLEKLCKMNSGGTPSRNNKSYYSGNIPWAKISDIEAAEGGIVYTTEEHITSEGLSAINNRLFEKETLLLAMYGSVGKVAFTGVDMSTNQAILGIRIIDETVLNYSYLKYWFQTIKSKLLNRAVGGTLQNISLGIVKDLEIPLPPLATQKRIAEILDAADALRRKDQELLKKYDELAQAIFIDMFGDPVKNEKGWQVKKLEELCLDVVDCPHTTPNHSTSITEYPCIRTSEMKNGKISWESMKYLNYEEYIKRVKRLTPQAGDIVYAREGTYGQAVLLPKNCHFSLGQRTMLLRPNKNIVNEEFLWYQINSDFVYRQARRKNMGSTVGHVNVADVKKFNIIFPPIALQKKFGLSINKLTHSESLVNMENSNLLFNSLLQKAFKGELV
jgi:type I restriction enzyme S subunit